MRLKAFSFERRITLGNLVNLLSFLLLITYGYAQRDYDLKELRNVSEGQAQRISKVEETVQEIKQSAKARDEALDWIKKTLGEIRDDIRELRQRPSP
jgi:hypothetical protein